MNFRIDPTPNPNSLKITVDASVPKAATYTGPSAPDPLANRLLSIPGVKSVFRLNNFCTVTKDPGADWNVVRSAMESALHELE